MKKLEVLVKELETKIPAYELINPQVSQGSVGWHIEHTLLTLNLIINAVKASDPQKYKWTLNWKRTIISTLGIIPRGKVKAPKAVQPKENFNRETLQQHIALAEEGLKSVNHLQADQYFTHPFFGDLNLKSTLRFLQIHTQHHLAIINDIIKSKS